MVRKPLISKTSSICSLELHNETLPLLGFKIFAAFKITLKPALEINSVLEKSKTILVSPDSTASITACSTSGDVFVSKRPLGIMIKTPLCLDVLHY